MVTKVVSKAGGIGTLEMELCDLGHIAFSLAPFLLK